MCGFPHSIGDNLVHLVHIVPQDVVIRLGRSGSLVLEATEGMYVFWEPFVCERQNIRVGPDKTKLWRGSQSPARFAKSTIDHA